MARNQTRRGTRAEGRGFQALTNDLKKARSFMANGKEAGPSSTSLNVVLGLRRTLLHPDDVMDSLSLNSKSTLRNVGFCRQRPFNRRDTSVSVIATGLALKMGQEFTGTSAEYDTSLQTVVRTLPESLTGKLGAVGIRGRNQATGVKRVGWYLEQDLRDTIRKEGAAVISAIGVPLQPYNPFLVLAETADWTQAVAWQVEIEQADTSEIPITLGSAIPYPLSIWRPR